MGLEIRNGTPIYTRSKRVGGKVKREYVASGKIAIVTHQMDRIRLSLEKEVWKQKHEDWQREIEAANALDNNVEAVCQEAVIMFRMVMDAAGYHQHARGQWRKKQKEKSDEIER